MHSANSARPYAKFKFKNIGPIKDAELDLGDITLIAGRNNTGKTYIVYTLYGFLKTWKSTFPLHRLLGGESLPDGRTLSQIVEKVFSEGCAEISLSTAQFLKQREKAVCNLARTFSNRTLAQIFSSHPSEFKDSSLQLEFFGSTQDQNWTRSEELPGGGSLLFKYDGTSLVITSKEMGNERYARVIEQVVVRNYLLLLVGGTLPEPFILSAERFGISLFYKELDFTKNQLVDMLQKLSDDQNRREDAPYILIDKATSRYALPIKDNIGYTRSIPDMKRERSEIYEENLFGDVKDMIGGYYSNSRDEIRFISKSRKPARSFNIPLHLASSSVRGLSDLYFFLRHAATANGLLMIDEPESHLDTANQVRLARLLARFVRAGLKVLVTTHSDYLIKEINNLVMLSEDFDGKKPVAKKLGYRSDDYIKPESIRAYIAENNGLTRCEVDQFGADMPVFDRTIDDINRVANELASRLPDNKIE